MEKINQDERLRKLGLSEGKVAEFSAGITAWALRMGNKEQAIRDFYQITEGRYKKATKYGILIFESDVMAKASTIFAKDNVPGRRNRKTIFEAFYRLVVLEEGEKFVSGVEIAVANKSKKHLFWATSFTGGLFLANLFLYLLDYYGIL